VRVLRSLNVSEIIGEAGDVELQYAEALLTALEDGVLTADELEGLASVTQGRPLDMEGINLAVLRAIIKAAAADGRIMNSERDEINKITEALGIKSSTTVRLLREAKDERVKQLSEGLAPLPPEWVLGEPLRVGDQVVFTGCDALSRERLERDSEKAGVRIGAKVGTSTAMLVTDGSFAGGKLKEAISRGTRIVSPEVYGVLLKHIQPAK
jgi:DNA polymerase-3 subunit epsilon